MSPRTPVASRSLERRVERSLPAGDDHSGPFLRETLPVASPIPEVPPVTARSSCALPFRVVRMVQVARGDQELDGSRAIDGNAPATCERRCGTSVDEGRPSRLVSGDRSLLLAVALGDPAGHARVDDIAIHALEVDVQPADRPGRGWIGTTRGSPCPEAGRGHIDSR